jgi:hypothetical protein
MWSERSLRKYIAGLEKSGVLISEQLRKRQHDQTKYYRIDYDHPLFDDATSANATSDDSNSAKTTSDDANSDDATGIWQDLPARAGSDFASSRWHDRVPSRVRDRATSYIETETSSETSAEKEDAAAAAVPDPAPSAVIADQLKAVGVKSTRATVDHYVGQVAVYGLDAVLAGIAEAARHDKAAVQPYVDKCIATAAGRDGTDGDESAKWRRWASQQRS